MTPAQIEAYVDAAAAALALPLNAEHRPGVLHYFALAAGMAELVAAQSLGIADDAAEAFVPIVPMAPMVPGGSAPR
jgi:Protein of unknown function (DUF4089)